MSNQLPLEAYALAVEVDRRNGDQAGSDCAYWGLTWPQCARYHARLARYWAGRSSAHAAAAVRDAKRATRLGLIALVLLAASLALRVVAVVLS